MATPSHGSNHVLPGLLLALITGGVFLLLSAVSIALYCCARLRNKEYSVKTSTQIVIDESFDGLDMGKERPRHQESSTTTSTPLPIFEFSPPSPTWKPALPSFTAASQDLLHPCRGRPGAHFGSNSMEARALEGINAKYTRKTQCTGQFASGTCGLGTREGVPPPLPSIRTAHQPPSRFIPQNAPYLLRAYCEKPKKHPTQCAPANELSSSSSSMPSRSEGKKAKALAQPDDTAMNIVESRSGLGITTVNLGISAPYADQRSTRKGPGLEGSGYPACKEGWTGKSLQEDHSNISSKERVPVSNSTRLLFGQEVGKGDLTKNVIPISSRK